MKLVQDEPEPAPTAAGHSPKAKAQPSQPSSADSEFLMPSSKDISEQVERSIQDKSFARIMEVVRGSEYYNKDLNEHDVLELIPRGLAISPHNPDYLCCVYCRSKNQIGPYTIFPSGNGMKNHFKRARHDVREPQVPEPSQPPPPDPAARSHPALAVSPPPSPPIPPPPPRLPVFLRLRRLRHPNLLSPSLFRHFLPLQHPRLLHQMDRSCANSPSESFSWLCRWRNPGPITQESQACLRQSLCGGSGLSSPSADGPSTVRAAEISCAADVISASADGL